MDDAALLGQVLDGDQAAFTALVKRYHALLVRTARFYVRGESQAEDVAQDTWMAVIRGIDKFEGRSSFKTWLLSILVNRARSSGAREMRSVPIDPTDPGPDVDPARFNSAGGTFSLSASTRSSSSTTGTDERVVDECDAFEQFSAQSARRQCAGEHIGVEEHPHETSRNTSASVNQPAASA